MPAVSGKQYRFMAGIAHGMKPRSGASKSNKGLGPSPAVARDFVMKTPPEKRSQFAKQR
jgi:hypothetical protein